MVDEASTQEGDVSRGSAGRQTGSQASGVKESSSEAKQARKLAVEEGRHTGRARRLQPGEVRQALEATHSDNRGHASKEAGESKKGREARQRDEGSEASR